MGQLLQAFPTLQCFGLRAADTSVLRNGRAVREESHLRRRKLKKLIGFSALTLMAILASAPIASAAVLNSTAQSVQLTATANESLTVTLTNASVTWPAMNPGQNSTDSNNQAGAVQVLTAWRLANSRNSVKVYSYFTSASAAMTGQTSGATIPSSAVMIKGGDLGSYTAVSQNPPATNLSGPSGVAGAALLLKSVALDATNRNSSDSHTYNFALDLSASPLDQLPSETYTGTLYIEAQTTP